MASPAPTHVVELHSERQTVQVVYVDRPYPVPVPQVQFVPVPQLVDRPVPLPVQVPLLIDHPVPWPLPLPPPPAHPPPPLSMPTPEIHLHQQLLLPPTEPTMALPPAAPRLALPAPPGTMIPPENLGQQQASPEQRLLTLPQPDTSPDAQDASDTAEASAAQPNPAIRRQPRRLLLLGPPPPQSSDLATPLTPPGQKRSIEDVEDSPDRLAADRQLRPRTTSAPNRQATPAVPDEVLEGWLRAQKAGEQKAWEFFLAQVKAHQAFFLRASRPEKRARMQRWLDDAAGQPPPRIFAQQWVLMTKKGGVVKAVWETATGEERELMFRAANNHWRLQLLEWTASQEGATPSHSQLFSNLHQPALDPTTLMSEAFYQRYRAVARPFEQASRQGVARRDRSPPAPSAQATTTLRPRSASAAPGPQRRLPNLEALTHDWHEGARIGEAKNPGPVPPHNTYVRRRRQERRKPGSTLEGSPASRVRPPHRKGQNAGPHHQQNRRPGAAASAARPSHFGISCPADAPPGRYDGPLRRLTLVMRSSARLTAGGTSTQRDPPPLGHGTRQPHQRLLTSATTQYGSHTGPNPIHTTTTNPGPVYNVIGNTSQTMFGALLSAQVPPDGG